MTARLIFDENIPVKVVQGLKAVAGILAPGVQIEFLPHFMRQYEMRDEVWLPKLVKDGWVVVTADRAKRSGGQKLPQICANLGLTHVLVGPSVHSLRQMSKLATLLMVWDDLIAAATEMQGHRYRLVRSGSVSRLERV